MKYAFLNICKYLLLVLAMTSCNHLFYYPDTYFYADPANLKVKYNNLVWTNSEGLKLQVLEMLPEGEEKATVLHLHGNAQNRSSHFQFSYWLTKFGYRVIVPDYRGYGGSEGKPSRDGLLEDGKFFLKQSCGLTQKPVFLFGQSLGGAVAIPALVQSKDARVCGLIIESSFPSYRRIARQKLDSFWLTWPFQYLLSFLVGDSESPIDYASKVSIPSLFIYGTADAVVPYEFGKELYDAVGSSEKELWTIPNAGHTPAFAELQSPYQQKLADWLVKQTSKCKSHPSH